MSDLIVSVFKDFWLMQKLFSHKDWLEYKSNPASLDTYVKLFFDNVFQDTMDFYEIHNDKQMFATVFKIFGKCSIPNKKWERLMEVCSSKDDKKRQDTFEDVYTAHEEAFIYVILEGNFAKWKAECSWRFEACKENAAFFKAVKIPKDILHDGTTIPPSKYTNAKSKKNLYSGWSAEGIESFNKHMQNVDEFRRSIGYNSAVLYSLDNCNNRVHVVKRRRTNDDLLKKMEAKERLDSAVTMSYKRSKFGEAMSI